MKWDVIPEPELQRALDFFRSGELIHAREFCVACLKIDSNRLDFQLLLTRARALLGDSKNEVTRCIDGAVEIANTLNFQCSSVAQIASAIRLVIDLVATSRIDSALRIAKELDRIRDLQGPAEFLLGGMWFVLGDSEILQLLMQDPEHFATCQLLDQIYHEIDNDLAGEDVLTRIEALEFVVQQNDGWGNRLVRCLFDNRRVFSGHGIYRPTNTPFEEAQWPAHIHEIFEKILAPRGHAVRSAGEVVPSEYRATDEWMAKIIAHARYISSVLRLAPATPSILSSGELLVAIAIDDEHLYGWVATRRRGTPVSLSLNDWSVTVLHDDAFSKFALGLSILWFLDCSLRRYGLGKDHYTPDEENIWRPSNSTWSTTTLTRDPSWETRVRGSVVRLPDGFTPSMEALDRAPSWMRARMQENETWRREHRRGGEDVFGEYVSRMKSVSNVAEGLSELRKGHRDVL